MATIQDGGAEGDKAENEIVIEKSQGCEWSRDLTGANCSCTEWRTKERLLMHKAIIRLQDADAYQNFFHFCGI